MVWPSDHPKIDVWHSIQINTSQCGPIHVNTQQYMLIRTNTYKYIHAYFFSF
jgi:hypothetical protein